MILRSVSKVNAEFECDEDYLQKSSARTVGKFSSQRIFVGLGGITSCRISKKPWKLSRITLLNSNFFLLIGTSAFAIFILRFPFYDGILARIILAAIAALATLLMIPISGRTPVATPFALSISFGAIAVLLLVSGSLKVALIASSLSLTSGICAMLAFWCRGFSGGASFARDHRASPCTSRVASPLISVQECMDHRARLG